MSSLNNFSILNLIIPSLIGFFSFLLHVFIYSRGRKASISCIVRTKVEVKKFSGGFTPYIKRFLIIRNLSKRDTAIIDICEYTPEESLNNILNDQIVILKGWSLKQIELTGDHINKAPLAILIRDMDDNSLYGVGVSDLYNHENDLSYIQERFRNIDTFYRYFNRLNNKLRVKSIKSLRIKTVPWVKQYVKHLQREQGIKQPKSKKKGGVLIY